ncbi:hypothetical protein [Halorubrum sp. CBA1229]|uniref:hypothetical protein n=1 Tax=Halorubrum sp. CBA1229 TaxID=1853699 RepID=UPI000F3EF47F|nr:hypothetical protein [Halorubrum sp. CBA1229]QKY16383.1 hypothetical protein Hrr1229_005635 [Halorubrum sp. CBA1229]
MAKMEMDAIDASFVVGLASVFMIAGHTRTKTAKSIRRVASSAINKPSRSDPWIARLLESESGKDEFAEAGDYRGLTDTAETYPEHEASEFAIVMEDDEDGDDAVDADDLKRREATGSDRQRDPRGQAPRHDLRGRRRPRGVLLGAGLGPDR